MKKKLFKLPDYWDNYIVSILLHMILPLLPILIELFISKEVNENSLTLAASMYAITIGISSKSKVQFGIGILTSVFFAVSYGVSIAQTETENINLMRNSAIWCISAVFIFHLFERYNRHVIDRTPFFNF